MFADRVADGVAADAETGADGRAGIDAGLGGNATYMRELDDDLTAARASYVGLAVTEIATLRGQLSGPQQG